MNIKRFLAILHARNLEFIRDRAALGWSIMLPVFLIFGFAFLFSNPDKDIYKVGIHAGSESVSTKKNPAIENFLATKYIQFINESDLKKSIEKVTHHQLDMLIDLSGKPSYWINSTSPKGYVLERMLRASASSPSGITAYTRQTVTGREIRYIDWAMPGILAMNMMFGSLFGIGYVIVRYRKNGVLKRLKATPLTAFEFISAQIFSRLLLTLSITILVFLGTNFFVDFIMLGSYFTLFLVYTLGAFCLISLALILASRTESEEFAGGILNLITWPMMIFSGVWFSLEGLPPTAQYLSKLLPLTHIVDAARAVMNDGAGMLDIMPDLLVLLAMSILFLFIGAMLFRWK